MAYSRSSPMLLLDTFSAELSSPAAFGCTVAGGASAGIVLALMGISPKLCGRGEADKENVPLLSAKSSADCAAGNWHPAESEVDATSKEPTVAASGGMFSCAVLFAIPSILGSWCWPLLLVTLFGAGANTASAANREASHHFTWGADLVLFGMVFWYMIESTLEKQERREVFSKWGPVSLVGVGSILIMLDITRHVLLDHDGVLFKPEDISMYADDGSLSPVGRLCQRTTQFGLAIVLVGIIWYLRLPEKIQRLRERN